MLTFICESVCVVYVHAFVWVHVFTGLQAHGVQRLTSDLFLGHSLLYFLRQGLRSKPVLTSSAVPTIYPPCSGNLVPTSRVLGLQVGHPACLAFMWVLGGGMQTQVGTLEWQVLSPPNLLPRAIWIT